MSEAGEDHPCWPDGSQDPQKEHAEAASSTLPPTLLALPILPSLCSVLLSPAPLGGRMLTPAVPDTALHLPVLRGPAPLL